MNSELNITKTEVFDRAEVKKYEKAEPEGFDRGTNGRQSRLRFSWKKFFRRVIKCVILAFPLYFFVFVGNLASDDVMSIAISKDYADRLASGEIKIRASSPSIAEFSLEEAGVNVNCDTNKFNEILHSVTLQDRECCIEFNEADLEGLLVDLNSRIESVRDAEIESTRRGEISVKPGRSGLRYDKDEVMAQIVDRLESQSSSLQIVPFIVEPEITEEDLEERLHILDAISEDIYVIYGSVTVVVSDSQVLEFLDIDCGGDACEVELNRDSIGRYVNENLMKSLLRRMEYSDEYGFEFRLSDEIPEEKSISDGIVDLLESRIKEVGDWDVNVLGVEDESMICPNGSCAKANTVEKNLAVVGVDAPATDGTYAERYIEIDDSQQHLYVWEGGEVKMSYGISGFYEGWDFFGKYAVINKSRNAWSPIAEKWMPYWMAYYYDKEQEAWLGIHELTQWQDPDSGEWIEETSENIGLRKSTGCVRLDRGAAKEVYDWARVGDAILLHP